MSSFHRSALTAALFFLCAASLPSQATIPQDTLATTTLPTVTVSAEAPGSWFFRAYESRQAILDMASENRELRRTLRRLNGDVVHLEARLDSLRGVEASRQRIVAALGDSIAATRSRRRDLEARLANLETRLPPPRD